MSEASEFKAPFVGRPLLVLTRSGRLDLHAESTSSVPLVPHTWSAFPEMVALDVSADRRSAVATIRSTAPPGMGIARCMIKVVDVAGVAVCFFNLKLEEDPGTPVPAPPGPRPPADHHRAIPSAASGRVLDSSSTKPGPGRE